MNTAMDNQICRISRNQILDVVRYPLETQINDEVYHEIIDEISYRVRHQIISVIKVNICQKLQDKLLNSKYG